MHRTRTEGFYCLTACLHYRPRRADSLQIDLGGAFTLSFKVCGISNNLDGTEDKLVRCKYISEELQDQPGDLHQEEDFEEDPFAEFDLDNKEEPGVVWVVYTVDFVMSTLV